MTSDLIAPGTPGFALVCLAALAVLINGLAFLAFALDRRRALAGEGRVSGQLLLALALVGGSLGAKLGQVWFARNPGKRGLAVGLSAILVLQMTLTESVVLPIVPTATGLVQSAAQRLAVAGDALGEIPAFSWNWWFGEFEKNNEHQRMPGQVRRFGPGSADEHPVGLF